MRQAEDIVWRTITESAKGRFDYAEFKNRLAVSEDERTAEFILFLIIEGTAEGLSAEQLLSKVSGDLLLFGYSVSNADLEVLLTDKKEILSAEVHAARMVLSGFSQGQHAPELLEQVHKLLS